IDDNCGSCCTSCGVRPSWLDCLRPAWLDCLRPGWLTCSTCSTCDSPRVIDDCCLDGCCMDPCCYNGGRNHMWFTGEYLLYSFSRPNLPPLVTAGTAGTPLPNNPALTTGPAL